MNDWRNFTNLFTNRRRFVLHEKEFGDFKRIYKQIKRGAIIKDLVLAPDEKSILSLKLHSIPSVALSLHSNLENYKNSN